MNKLFNIFAILFLLLVGSGCQKFLDLVPEDDIEDLETIFERDVTARNWFKSCYVKMNQMLPDYYNNPSLMGTNEFVMNDIMRRDNQYTGLAINAGLQNSYIPYANIWLADGFYEDIRYINIFLDKVDGVYDMLEADKRLMKAELLALKAQIYFELLRRYGPFIIVNETLDITTSDKDMQRPRAHLDDCVEEIVTLIDSAYVNLQPLNLKDISRKTFHSRESALMIKAQALFFAASDIFNGNAMYADVKNYEGVAIFPQIKDKEKWGRALEATLEAIEEAESGGVTLVKNLETKSTEILSAMYDIENSVLAPGYVNSEAIHMVRPASPNNGQGTLVNLQLPRIALLDGATNHAHYNVSHLGIFAPSIEMVEKYYTENGLPLEVDPNYFADKYAFAEEIRTEMYRGVVPTGAKTVALHLRREPRFYAHIAADRTYWQRGPTSNDNIIVEAHKGELFGTTLDLVDNNQFQNHTGYWCKKGLDSDIQTQEYLSSISNPEYGYIAMRLSELYLMASEAANEYYATPTENENVYKWINLVRERAGIPSVQESWEQIAGSDLHKSQAGMRTIIRQEWAIEFAFEGTAFWNNRRWLTAAAEMTKPLRGWNILGTDLESFYRNGQGPMIVCSRNTFMPPRDYLFPIKAEEVLISGIVQNKGW